MRKIVASLILTCAAFLTGAGQESDLKIPAEVAPFVEKDTKAIALEAADLNTRRRNISAKLTSPISTRKTS